MSSLSKREMCVLAEVRARAADMAATVERWSNINSGSRNPAGLREMRDILAERLAPLADRIEICPPDPVTALDDVGEEQPVLHGDNVRARKRTDAPRRVLLTGHMDTVFAANDPFQRCRMVQPGVLNGPGTADMKGGLLILLEAIRAVEDEGALSGLGWDVVINADEEVSSLGSASLLRRAAQGCAIGLTFEPSLTPDGVLAGTRAGSGNFTACVRGRAAHAGRNPEGGRNAVVAAADLALRLDRWARQDAGVSANIARVSGGGPSNIVPDLALLWWNMRPADAAAQLRAEQAIEDERNRIEREHDVSVQIHGRFHRPPKPMDDRHRALFAFVEGIGADLGLALPSCPTGGVCDGNNIAAEGLSVIDTLGARGGAIHTADEFLILDSLVERAGLAAITMMRLAEGRLDGEVQW